MDWRIQTSEVAILILDMQEKLLPEIDDHKKLENKICQLTQACRLLDIPVVATQQYPKGLGKTVKSVQEALGDAPVVNKLEFSAVSATDKLNRKHILVAGIEAHICVRQTVYDLRRENKIVHLVADAIGSRDPYTKQIAVAEMQTDGVLITSVEAFLFEVMQSSEHPKFKEISTLLK
ncbi:MAG: isochorismatase family protein [Verrucomicrobiota bacterium]